MLIAIDSEMLYRRGVKYPGNGQLIENLMALDNKIDFLVIAETLDDGERAARMVEMPAVEVITRYRFDHERTVPDIHICTLKQKYVKNGSVLIRG